MTHRGEAERAMTHRGEAERAMTRRVEAVRAMPSDTKPSVADDPNI
jgi:hypothetical protein